MRPTRSSSSATTRRPTSAARAAATGTTPPAPHPGTGPSTTYTRPSSCGPPTTRRRTGEHPERDVSRARGPAAQRVAEGGPAPNWPDAPCRGRAALFFPPQGNAASHAVRQAKTVCAGCKYRQPCLEYALTAQGSPGRWVEGVWGGTTSKQRDEIRKARRDAEREAA